MIYAITTVHCEPVVLASSLAAFLRTEGKLGYKDIDRWTFLAHGWPIETENFEWCVMNIIEMVQGREIRKRENIGSHSGFSYCLEQFPFTDDDFILCYDSDSYPITRNWLTALVDVMKTDPSIGYLSLLDERCVDNRPWNFETIGNHVVSFHPDVDMINITLFRGSVLRKGMLAPTKYWGNMEVSMDEHAKSLGLRHGYLYNHREDKHPIAHPKSYSDWKLAHARNGYGGNYDQWLKENP